MPLYQHAQLSPLQNSHPAIPSCNTTMRPLSAAEAIQPAIQRTRTVLFQPFQMGRSWKLAATAYLSGLGAFFIPTPIFSFFAKASQPHATFASLLLSMGFGT